MAGEIKTMKPMTPTAMPAPAPAERLDDAVLCVVEGVEIGEFNAVAVRKVNVSKNTKIHKIDNSRPWSEVSELWEVVGMGVGVDVGAGFDDEADAEFCPRATN